MAPMEDSDAANTFRGILRGGMAGIGGEHTGFELTLDGGSRLEVEPGSARGTAHALDGMHVIITGTVETKPYVERGNVKILRAATIQADASGDTK